MNFIVWSGERLSLWLMPWVPLIELIETPADTLPCVVLDYEPHSSIEPHSMRRTVRLTVWSDYEADYEANGTHTAGESALAFASWKELSSFSTERPTGRQKEKFAWTGHSLVFAVQSTLQDSERLTQSVWSAGFLRSASSMPLEVAADAFQPSTNSLLLQNSEEQSQEPSRWCVCVSLIESL